MGAGTSNTKKYIHMYTESEAVARNMSVKTKFSRNLTGEKMFIQRFFVTLNIVFSTHDLQHFLMYLYLIALSKCQNR